ncbi:glycosyl transferase family A [Pleurocapsa sp. CCALA 161]|uniref:glycosyltransferase family 2 protein n=1 Tax=Pleurocapsa sp. CCALA 161 TaxID=2107688 RepID=UPI000D069AD8|nr:glycosyltransferase family A protein [Pleurocapsa sp. CCALA 161]PSB08301.1 glycosyl transferase family A [Pleurocapsa sp. CCALA 161]
MPKVSVIIPAYNAIKYLPASIDSILTQTYTDFEIIIVNDGSKDGTEEWFGQLTDPDPRVQLISQTNQGNCAARNIGIAHAQSEYIAFLDADDLWASTKLAKQVEILEQNPDVGLVYTWVERIDQNGKSLGKPFESNLSGNIWEKLLARNVIATSSTLIRRSCFERVGKFDENLQSFVEDWDLWLRIAACYPIKVIPEYLLQYRECPTSISKNWQAMEKKYHIVIEKAFASAPSKLMFLKGKSYSCSYLHLASQSLQSNQPDYAIASKYLRQAIAYYPQMKFSQEYVRLKLTVWLMKWFGLNIYHKLHDRFRALRSYLVSLG